jgi:uncharacterized membrane protein
MSQLKIAHPLLQVLAIGALAGMRSSSAPVITSQILSRHQSKRLVHSRLSFMQSKAVANTFAVLSAGELIVDKLPTTPNRIKAGSVIFRSLSGALAGASIYKAIGKNTIIGALLGASSAFASTYISYKLRTTTVKQTHTIDPIIGAIEDILVVGAGIGLIRSARADRL